MEISLSLGAGMDPAAHSRFRPAKMPTRRDFAHAVVTSIWSPILWLGGRRRKSGFVKCGYAALDFDDGWTLEDALAWVTRTNLGAIIGTSKSHQLQKGAKSPCDRFRLVVPFAAPITDRRTYEYNMGNLIHSTGADTACADAARYFFPCTKIAHSVAGGSLPVLQPPTAAETPADRARGRQEAASYPEEGFPGWVHSLLNHGHTERHKACYRLGATLIFAGFAEENIVSLIMKGPLGEIGQPDVTRAVANGAAKAREEAAAEEE